MTAPTTQAPPTGLSEVEATRRRTEGQGNTTIPLTGRTYWQIVRENVFTFINTCLFALGLTLLLLRRPLDALISTGVILLNVLVSVVQEIRAKRTLDQIALLTRPTATVVRDSITRAVPPEELVLGDLLMIAPGDQVVVDGRLAAGRISVDESQLTGESHLIEKQHGDALFSGSFCVVGTASYTAEKVGAASLVHQMTIGARAFRRVLTPLQREVHRVIRITLVIVVYCEFLLVLRSLLQRVDLVTSVQNATIVANLIPNGLFLSISVTYALAAVRIIRFGALVQQANAIESLSHVDVVCFDKTGTLTANRLALSALVPLTISEAELRRALGDFVTTATTRNKTSETIRAACPGRQRHVTAEVPFSSARKWSALALDDQGDDALAPVRGVYVLGAPEMLAPYLAPHPAGTEAGEPTLAQRITPLANKGLRVLLLAHRDDPLALREDGDHAELPAGLRPLGLVALCDELRPEAQTALAALVRAGVQPKIISGDSPETVLALARQAGVSEARMVSGSELEHMDETQLLEAATGATVFGRVTPQQKERLVRALRQAGHYVAMIGDGVNDVLSLKQADVGIAMKSGSQATRGVADIVLMEDSFAALAPAVTEGQRILNGMRCILQLFLTRIGTVGAVILSSLIIGEFPLALRNGSLVTLFSVGIPTVLLAFWARPGPRPQGRFVGSLFHFVVTPVLVTSMIALPLLYGTFLLELQQAGALAPHVAPLRALELDTAIRPVAQTTLAIFLVFVGLLLVIFVAPPTRWWAVANELSSDSRPARLAVGLMAAFLLVLLAPPLRGLFALAPVSPLEIGLVAIALLLWLVAVRWLWSTRLLPRLVAG